MQVALLTVSDRASSGEYADETGPALRKVLEEGWPDVDISATAVVPDEVSEIQRVVTEWCDDDVALVITNGGTGLSTRDLTPEAVEPLLHRAIPGMAEAMRAAGRLHTPMADLSRQIAGQRGRTLVLSVPGSPKAATESLQAILGILRHAVEMIRS